MPAPEANNTYAAPDGVLPRRVGATRFEQGVLTATLEKASWNVFRFQKR